MPVQRHRPVRKTMHLFQAETAPIEARQNDASAFGAQVDRCYIARHHEYFSLSLVSSFASLRVSRRAERRSFAALRMTVLSARIRCSDAAINIEDIAGAFHRACW